MQVLHRISLVAKQECYLRIHEGSSAFKIIITIILLCIVNLKIPHYCHTCIWQIVLIE